MMTADLFEGRDIVTAMSILVMSWPFGIAMGQIGHVWLADAFGWWVPFQVASAYCLVVAIAVFVLYRPPHDLPAPVKGTPLRLSGQEWRLLLCAAFAWAVFNAAYVIYLSFGPKVLEGLGQTTLAAAAIISLGSWVMIGSWALCGFIADRFDRRRLILAACMVGAIAALDLLRVPGAGVPASLLFGLVGMAPAGVIMAMAGQAVRPAVRAFAMGVFFTVYYAIMLITPPLAGALFDATASAQGPIWLAMALFACVVPLALAFHVYKAGPAVAA